MKQRHDGLEPGDTMRIVALDRRLRHQHRQAVAGDEIADDRLEPIAPRIEGDTDDLALMGREFARDSSG